MIVKDKGGDFEQPEAGTYSANCYRLIDIGTQTDTYDGKTNTRRQVILQWEIDEKMADGQPFSIGKFYTASLHEKATLRHDLENWRGRIFTEKELEGFELKGILGAPCMLTLTQNDKGKIKVTAVSKLPKGMTRMAPVNPTVYFSLDAFDSVVFASLRDGLKKIITQSPEYQAAIKGGNGASAAIGNDAVEEDIPF